MPWEFFTDGRPPLYHTHPIRVRKVLRLRSDTPVNRIITKKEWGGVPSFMHPDDEVIPVKLPVSTVRYTYTDSWKCEDRPECDRLMRLLQENHISKFTFDIKWNFLIAPSGTIYEGRGWEVDAYRPFKFEYLRGDSIDIAYIGNYGAYPLPKVMSSAAKDLVDWGVANGKIICCHDSISHREAQVDDDNPEPLIRMKPIEEV